MENFFINQTPISFKTFEQFEQWPQLCSIRPDMYELAFLFAEVSWKTCHVVPVVTSIYRGPDHELYRKDSVHGYWRGVDFRVHDYTPEDRKRLLDFFNTQFIYDTHRPELKCMIIHGEEMNRHVHLQVSDRTYRKICLNT